MKKILMNFIIFVITILPISVFAIENEGSISVSLKYDEKPVSGVEFTLYKIASYDNDKLSNTDDFKNYELTFEDITDENTNTIIEELLKYINENEIKCYDNMKTNSNGMLTFRNLEKGIYLVVGNNMNSEDGKSVYISQPSLVTIPTKVEDEESYGVIIEPKCDYRDYIETLKVIKKWDDDNNPDRPKEITVQLLKDGKLFDEVVLNDENNWQYSWENLISYNYEVKEQNVPKGYTVSVEYKDYVFNITNSMKKLEASLPNTGQYWIPAICLLTIGILFIIIGCKIKKDEKKD